MAEELTASSGSLSVFINGGTTPLGLQLARQLVAAGHRVTATASGSVEGGKLRAMGALPAYPDLTRMGELKSAIVAAKASVVINLAPTYPYQAPQLARDWDVYTAVVGQGTQALLDAAKATGISYFIQASFSFLGGDDHGHHGDDDHEAPGAPFIDAAQDAEAAVEASGIPSTILRFGFVYSSDSAALQELRMALLRRRTILAGSDHTRANWIHAEDGARAAALCLNSRPVGQTLYVVDDKPVTPAGFLNTFAELIGVSAPGAMPSLLQPLFGSAAQLAMLQQPSGASNSETKALLGWSPRYATLAAGLDQALMMWRAEEPIKA